MGRPVQPGLRRPVNRKPSTKRGAGRGAAHFRLRAGFVLIAMVLSVFAARLVQLQGFDPHAYAAAAHKANLVDVLLPAKRGDILDRNGQPLADSVAGLMIVADPKLTGPNAAQIAKYLSNKLGVDYFNALRALQGTVPGQRYARVARHIPSTLATDALDHLLKPTTDGGLGLKGLTTVDDPVREYPAGDVAANLVGFTGTDAALGGLELNFNKMLSGKDGNETYEVGGGTRIPLGASTDVQPHNGATITTTIDSDLQWYAQRALAKAVTASGASSGVAAVMDSRTGEVLTFADYPTYDPNDPTASPTQDLGSRGLSDVYEPGSVQKVLTLSADIDAGHVTAATQEVVPNVLKVQDRVIHDWFNHPTMHWTLAGVIAQSSNIGTVLAADKFAPGQLRDYLAQFGLGQRTSVGISGESPGILPSIAQWTEGIQARVAFGQSVSVNALQMLTAVNTVANGGVYVSPSLIRGSATNDAGQVVGTDHATTHRVVSQDAATQMMQMMERVVDPKTGVAPKAQVPGYRIAGKTGTAQEVSAKCGCYDGSLDVSFAGFAPADNPRFTVYVVIKDPQTNKGGGSNAGPVFSQIMGFALRRYGVPPTGAKPSNLPVTWGG